MERDEFMNVDGEAEFDVDIMKELRYASEICLVHRPSGIIIVDHIHSRCVS